jgi:hypothetical protein
LFSAGNKDHAAECLKFEKEWKQIADKVETEQAVYLDKELSEL